MNKNFNLIYVRNIKVVNSGNFIPNNSVHKSQSPIMTDELKQHRQKIIETYISYIKKYYSANFLTSSNKNFCLRLGQFNHDKVNCLGELIKINDIFLLNENNKNKNFLTSSLVINENKQKKFILHYKNVETNSSNIKLIDYRQ